MGKRERIIKEIVVLQLSNNWQNGEVYKFGTQRIVCPGVFVHV